MHSEYRYLSAPHILIYKQLSDEQVTQAFKEPQDFMEHCLKTPNIRVFCGTLKANYFIMAHVFMYSDLFHYTRELLICEIFL